jgi:putative endonuclease
MFYVYLLASKPYGTLYVGVTSDLVKRVFEHKSKAVPGFTTRYGVNTRFEGHDSIEVAIRREKQIKERKRESSRGVKFPFRRTAVRQASMVGGPSIRQRQREPTPSRTAIGARGANYCALFGYRLPLRDRKFADSPLEEGGFELSVPREVASASPRQRRFLYVSNNALSLRIVRVHE